MKKFADFIIEKRGLVLIIMGLITLFFAFNMLNLKVYTKFSDLLPQGHKYIKTYNEIRAKFGGANTVTMIFQVRKGDIFNPATLKKIREITDELYYIPAVDRFKITSLAVNTVVDMKLISGGYDFVPLMFPNVPKTQEEADELREKVYASVFYGGLVWFDSKKTLITADFFDDEIDYSVVFKELIRIQKKYEDDNHILSMAGEPLHLGYINSYVGTIMTIMAITLVVMLCAVSLLLPLVPGHGAAGVYGRNQRHLGHRVSGAAGLQPGSAGDGLSLPGCGHGRLPLGAGDQALY